jgi:hypothetical protein
MPKFNITLYTEPQAPQKPVLGAPCNGCGICCLMEPCPLGVLLSGRRTGACAALRWHPDLQIYRCGAITEPLPVLLKRLPKLLHGLAPVLAWLMARLAHRWVAAGVGCDCDAHATHL